MSLLECSRVEKRTKVRKLEPPETLIWPPYLSPMVIIRNNIFCIVFCNTYLYNKCITYKRGKQMDFDLRFEWDEEKERKNIIKHEVSFKTAMRVFRDSHRIDFYDSGHSSDEDRYITIGSVNGTVLILMVVYTERGDAVRIISARKATSQERRRYYDHDES